MKINITLELDADLLSQARALTVEQGISVDALLPERVVAI